MTKGGRTVGTWLPAAPMKNIDTEAIRQEMYRKTYVDTLFAGVYAVGLVVSGILGFYFAKTALNDHGACLLSLGVMMIFIVAAYVTRRVLRRWIHG